MLLAWNPECVVGVCVGSERVHLYTLPVVHVLVCTIGVVRVCVWCLLVLSVCMYVCARVCPYVFVSVCMCVHMSTSIHTLMLVFINSKARTPQHIYFFL